MHKTASNTILICPLNWGLGHATRDIPIIRRLADKGYKIIIATQTPIKEIIDEAVPGLCYEYFPGPKITYSKSKFLVLKLISQVPLLIKWIKKEKAIISSLVKKYDPCLIISDNRYGAYHPKVHSIIITHQLMIKLPFLLKWAEFLAHKIISNLIHKFDECWIPDFNKEYSLAGDLVHLYSLPKHAKLIGPLSRFMDDEKTKEIKHTQYNCLAIISGPEPQKTILKDTLIKTLRNNRIKSLFLTGNPHLKSEKRLTVDNFTTLLPHLNQDKLKQLISSTPLIIARSGYTTIMDMYYLNKKAILIPTPGQTEQNYLAKHNKKRHICLSQNKLADLKINLNEWSQLLKPLSHQKENKLLQDAIDKLKPY